MAGGNERSNKNNTLGNTNNNKARDNILKGSFGSPSALWPIAIFDSFSCFVHHPRFPVLESTLVRGHSPLRPVISPHSAPHAEKAVPVFSFSSAPLPASPSHSRNTVQPAARPAPQRDQPPRGQRRRAPSAGRVRSLCGRRLRSRPAAGTHAQGL